MKTSIFPIFLAVACFLFATSFCDGNDRAQRMHKDLRPAVVDCLCGHHHDATSPGPDSPGTITYVYQCYYGHRLSYPFPLRLPAQCPYDGTFLSFVGAFHPIESK